MRTNQFLISCLLLIYTQYLFAFSMNDVSVLLPLPKSNELSEFIGPETAGDKGSLLPRSVYDRLPNLTPDTKPDVVYKELLHVVAIRIDPCFVEGVGPKACHRQVRMIWQPIIASERETYTRDAAVHTFYEFGENEWREVIDEWKKFSEPEVGEALSVHPKLALEGFSGAFWKNIRTAILKFCGAQNLTRATAMNVMNGEQVWAFAGVDIRKTEVTSILIPRIGRTVQGIVMGTANTDEFTGSIRPAAAADPELEAFVQDSIGMKKNEKELIGMIKRIHEYENPKLNNPGTVDCVSCHLAQSARAWAQTNFQSWDWKSEFKDNVYVAPLNITNASEMPFKSNHFRAFGYFYDKAMISQRVINETAEVVQALSAE